MKVILLLVVCIYLCEAYPNCNTNDECPNGYCCALTPDDKLRLCARKPRQGNACTGLYHEIEPKPDDHCSCGSNMTCQSIENSGNTYYFCVNKN